jgi:hypothetical protein
MTRRADATTPFSTAFPDKKIISCQETPFKVPPWRSGLPPQRAGGRSLRTCCLMHPARTMRPAPMTDGTK